MRRFIRELKYRVGTLPQDYCRLRALKNEIGYELKYARLVVDAAKDVTLAEGPEAVDAKVMQLLPAIGRYETAVTALRHTRGGAGRIGAVGDWTASQIADKPITIVSPVYPHLTDYILDETGHVSGLRVEGVDFVLTEDDKVSLTMGIREAESSSRQVSYWTDYLSQQVRRITGVEVLDSE